MTAWMATAMPPAVVTRASEMPAATTLKPPWPETPIWWKACMMPTTVPNRPMKGAVAPMVPRSHSRARSRRLSCCRCRSTAAVIRSAEGARAGRPGPAGAGELATSAARKTSAAGESERSHCARASSRSPRKSARVTASASVRAVSPKRHSARARSTATATAATEKSTMSHMAMLVLTREKSSRFTRGRSGRPAGQGETYAKAGADQPRSLRRVATARRADSFRWDRLARRRGVAVEVDHLHAGRRQEPEERAVDLAVHFHVTPGELDARLSGRRIDVERVRKAEAGAVDEVVEGEIVTGVRDLGRAPGRRVAPQARPQHRRLLPERQALAHLAEPDREEDEPLLRAHLERRAGQERRRTAQDRDELLDGQVERQEPRDVLGRGRSPVEDLAAQVVKREAPVGCHQDGGWVAEEVQRLEVQAIGLLDGDELGDGAGEGRRGDLDAGATAHPLHAPLARLDLVEERGRVAREGGRRYARAADEARQREQEGGDECRAGTHQKSRSRRARRSFARRCARRFSGAAAGARAGSKASTSPRRRSKRARSCRRTDSVSASRTRLSW